MRAVTGGLVSALFVGTVTRAGGQVAASPRASLSGIVIEQLSRTPVPSVSIHLLTSSGEGLSTTITDAGGRFRFDVPDPGTYRVRVERMGYLRTESPQLSVAPGESRVLQVELTRRPVLLDSVFVRSARDAAPPKSTEQLIHGRLLDDDTGEPIAGGTIELRDSKAKSITKTTSNAEGLFRIVTPSPGTYSLRGEQFGYRSAQQDELQLRLGDSLVIDFRLSRKAAILAPVLVTASAKPWGDRNERRSRQELYDRMQRFGHRRYAQFIIRDTIDAYDRRYYSTTEMLKRVVVVPFPDEHHQSRERRCTGSKFFVDGFPSVAPEELGAPDTFGSAAEFWPLRLLDVIEVFTHPTLPAEFSSPVLVPKFPSAAVPPCRVISLWTRPRN